MTVIVFEAKIDLVQTNMSSHAQIIASFETNADAVSEPIIALETTCTELTRILTDYTTVGGDFNQAQDTAMDRSSTNSCHSPDY